MNYGTDLYNGIFALDYLRGMLDIVYASSAQLQKTTKRSVWFLPANGFPSAI
jgi:hypothetical protein